MPLADYLSYSAGYMPKKDVAAQLRCFKYLSDAILKMDALYKKTGEQNYKNRATVFTDIRNMIEVASGSMRFARATTFWKYWDKNKEMIISTTEGTKDSYSVQDKIGELEEGRYFPN